MYKARLVANGRSQQFRADCDKTFSSVVKLSTIHTVLSLALSRGWPIHQLDVKNDFLDEDLSETVYMYQPPGFVDSRFQRFTCYALRAGISSSRCDSSLFIYRHGTEEFDIIDLGALNYILGISVTLDSSGMFLSQKEYVMELLEWAHMTKCNATRTPVDTESKLGSDRDLISDPTLYCTLNFSLQLYASPSTSLVAYSDVDWVGCLTTR
ncbi:ribonuclease H-like domain-containing protein [Tanacetum coccineum]